MMSLMLGGFWQQVLDADMAVPRERPLNDLTAELVTMLGSTNPVERDDVAYALLAAWVSGGTYDDLLVTFGDSIAQGLKRGLGWRDDDTVFRRSFSALVLAECIERDSRATVLPIDAVLNWADAALSWFSREQDLRGWVGEKGWAHAVAHGADLLGALAQSRHLGSAHLGVLLDVIAERLASSTSRVLTDGEDDRLATATMMILHRNLVGQDQLDAWVETLARGLSRPRGYQGTYWPSFSASNTSAYVRALYLQLAVGARPRHTTLSVADAPECRADLLLALLTAIPRFTPSLYPPVASRND